MSSYNLGRREVIISKNRIKNETVFLISGVIGLVLAFALGVIAVSDNNAEIKRRKEVIYNQAEFSKDKIAYQKAMKEKGIQTDSLNTFLKTTCECDKDSIALVKMAKSSNVKLSKKEFKNLYKVLSEYRYSKEKLNESWANHVSSVESVEGWSGEKRSKIALN